MKNWLCRLDTAVANKKKSEIIALRREHAIAQWVWTDAPADVYESFRNFTNRATAILHGTH